jgi:hypothetical protein
MCECYSTAFSHPLHLLLTLRYVKLTSIMRASAPVLILLSLLTFAISAPIEILYLGPPPTRTLVNPRCW